MRISFIKFKVVLFCAVFLLFISVFANRIVVAKNSSIYIKPSIIKNNLPAEYVWTTNLTGITKDVFHKVNQERKRIRLKPMRWHSDLADLAYDYSKKMANEKFFSHYDNDGNSVVERAEDHDITDWLKIGENLFQCEGYEYPANIAVKGWLKSRTHRKNIYDREWTHTGIGVYKTRGGEVFITQVFLKK